MHSLLCKISSVFSTNMATNPLQVDNATALSAFIHSGKAEVTVEGNWLLLICDIESVILNLIFLG